MNKLIAILILFLSYPAMAKICGKADNYFAKYDFKAANGECVQPVPPGDVASIDNIFSSHNIKVSYADNVKANKNELHAAAEVIQAISHLSGGNFDLHQGFNFRLHSPYKRKSDNRTVTWSTCINNDAKNISTLMLNRSGCQAISTLNSERKDIGTGRNNSAHIAHEMAHCFGWKTLPGDSKNLYSRYRSAVGDSCKPTHYCNKNKNENFAESFALYLMNPDRLQNEPGCEKAIKFFAEVFSENVPTAVNSKTGNYERDYSQVTCEQRRSSFQSLGHFTPKSRNQPTSKSITEPGSTGTVTFEESSN